jgi:di/tricarboxylate transporter
VTARAERPRAGRSASSTLRTTEDFVPLRLPREFEADPPAREKAPLALAITGAMLVALTLQLAPSVIVVLVAAIALVLGRCLSMPEAYRAINWQSIVLIGGMIPMATALEVSGALPLIVGALTEALGEAGPMALMAALMALTSVLSQVISNTATTVLVAPVALAAAQRLGVDPHPMLLGVAIAASTAFSTPVASPVNTLVLGPGGYRFSDFLKVGLPLQLAALAAALVAIPLLRPF